MINRLVAAVFSSPLSQKKNYKKKPSHNHFLTAPNLVTWNLRIINVLITDFYLSIFIKLRQTAV